MRACGHSGRAPARPTWRLAPRHSYSPARSLNAQPLTPRSLHGHVISAVHYSVHACLPYPYCAGLGGAPEGDRVCVCMDFTLSV